MAGVAIATTDTPQITQEFKNRAHRPIVKCPPSYRDSASRAAVSPMTKINAEGPLLPDVDIGLVARRVSGTFRKFAASAAWADPTGSSVQETDGANLRTVVTLRDVTGP